MNKMAAHYSFGIKKPCSENWATMTPTEKGAFCSACALEVRDFSQMPLEEVVDTLKSEMGKRVCGRLSTTQEKLLRNTRIQLPSRSRRMRQISLLAFIAVFGMTLFSCSNPIEENFIRGIQHLSLQIVEKASPPDSVVNQGMDSLSLEFIHNYNEHEFIMGDIAQEYYLVPLPPPVEEPEVEEVTELIDRMSYSEYEHVKGRVEIVEDISVLAFPNPTAGELTIRIDLPEGEKLTVEVFDQQGAVRQSVFSGRLAKGSSDLKADLSDLPAGVYLIRVVSKKFKDTQRVIKI